MSYPLHPLSEPKKIKRNRAMFFKPTFKVYGFETQAAFDHDRWTDEQIALYASDPKHPNYQRALAALEVAA